MHGAEIAIIGMSGRFPEAENIDSFWKNLIKGHEAIKFLTDQELDSLKGSEMISDPRYVPSKGGHLEGSRFFDAGFFGYSPREAEIMDPQFRIFHECVWQALEDAGYAKTADSQNIGLYAGASGNSDWHHKLLNSRKYANRSGLAGIQFVERDFLPTLISYNLDLKGPSYNVQTACSTSLVAVHLACQAILNGECNIALAGGVSIATNTEKGYIYKEGSVLSPDGHCRAFDASAKGSIYGSGAGIVALKLLEEAIEDRDNIYAVIRGSAINNDGKRKVGFTAPSIFGQTEVIKAAHLMAEIQPEDVLYIEAHGTGTELGDPIEVEALKTAFGESGRNYCGIGSVKTNIGHLDAAAGVTGLIKTALSIKYNKIPASLNFEAPNPKIDFTNSPFYVVNQSKSWPEGKKKIAGVSSFGIGGTNAHVVIEEAPALEASPSEKAFHIVPFSAKSQSSLLQWADKFSAYVQETDEKLEDIAHTLIKGRKDFPVRGYVVAGSNRELAEELRNPLTNQDIAKGIKKSIVFMFPGQGAQYLGMGLNLFEKEPVFRTEMLRGMKIYNAITGMDMEDILYAQQKSDARPDISETRITQPLLFMFEYSLARLLMHFGVSPSLMVGHSIGEYVAACISGVFSMEDALKLVIKRGELIQKLPAGSMLSIGKNESEVKHYIKGNICLAAVNTSSQCVLSGPTAEIMQLKDSLEKEGVPVAVLQTSHAFHSAMMEPALADYADVLKMASLNPPKTPLMSNYTGQQLSAEEAISPVYWINHLRYTVRFADNIENIMSQENVLFLEVGPGNALASMVSRHKQRKESHHTISLVRHVKQNISDDFYFYEGLGKLWMAGVDITFHKLYENEERKTVSLPTYCFEKQEIPSIDAVNVKAEIVQDNGKHDEKLNINKWFYTQAWSQKVVSPHPLQISGHNLILFGDDTFAEAISSTGKYNRVILVKVGESYSSNQSTFTIDPGNPAHYQQLLKDLNIDHWKGTEIIHAWSLGDITAGELSLNRCRILMDLTYYSIVDLIRIFGHQLTDTNLSILTRNAFEVTGGDCKYPEFATNVALAKILPLEYKELTCQLIDVSEDLLEVKGKSIFETIIQAVNRRAGKVTALRGDYQWVPEIKPVQSDLPTSNGLVEETKNYLILGLGGMAIYMAKYLSQTKGNRVFIFHRSDFPDPKEWDNILSEGNKDQLTTKINILKDIRESGKGEVRLIQCDITDLNKMRQNISLIEDSYGKIYGVIQTAGAIDNGGIVQRRTNQSIEENISAKVYGTLIVDTLFRDRELDLFVFFSSIGNELYVEKYGELAYNTGNEFLDAYAYHKSGIKRKMVIDWCDWQEVGMAVKSIEALFSSAEARDQEQEIFRKMAIKPQEGIEVFARACRSGLKRVAVYPSSLITRLEHQEEILKNYSKFLEEKFKLLTDNTRKLNKSINKTSSVDDNVISIWKDYLGYENISLHDNIFELGASSLDVVQINNIFKSELGIDVPVTTLFEHPTIASFLKHVKGAEKEESTNTAERIDRGMNRLGKLKRVTNS